MYSNNGFVETFVYLDKILTKAIYRSGTIKFARSMYEFNVINKDIYEAMTKISIVLDHNYDAHHHSARVLSKILMEVISNPKGYIIFKESLKKKNSLIKLHHQINILG